MHTYEAIDALPEAVPGQEIDYGASGLKWLFAVLSFLLFFPNPALPIGNSTGIQLGQVLSAIALPFLLLGGIPRRQSLALAALTLPLVLSAGTWLLFSGGEQDMILKAVGVHLFAMIPMVFMGAAIDRGLHRAMLGGAAVAILVHCGLAFEQWFAFTRGEFPLLALFQNPSFLQPTENYALWTHRVTALFPEPSAMAASIGPWLVLMAAFALTRGAAQKFGSGSRALMTLVVVSGVAVILLSGTGYSVLLVAVLGGMWAFGTLASPDVPATRKAFSIILMIAAIVVAASIGGAALQTRVDSVDGLSWDGRLASLRLGLSSLASGPQTLLVGDGPGLSTNWLANAGGSELALSKVGVVAVWSAQIRYICETGIVGAAAILGVMVLVIAAIRRSSERLVGAACLVAWLMATWLTTSYVELEPMWLFLGLLLSWDRLFPSFAYDVVAETMIAAPAEAKAFA